MLRGEKGHGEQKERGAPVVPLAHLRDLRAPGRKHCILSVALSPISCTVTTPLYVIFTGTPHVRILKNALCFNHIIKIKTHAF